MSSPTRIHQLPHSVVNLAGWTGMAVGVAVMAGWLFDIDILKRALPGLVTMKFNTALFLAFGGGILWLRSQNISRYTSISRILGAVVAVGGVVVLFQYFFGWNMGIDEWIVSDPARIETSQPGRMSPLSAISFTLLGVASILTSGRSIQTLRIGQLLSVAVGLLAYTVLVGYGLQVTSLYRVANSTSVAIHGAAAFFVLSIGTLSIAPDHGITEGFFNDLPGSRMVRRLLLSIMLLPIACGFLVDRMGQANLLAGTSEAAVLISLLTFVLMFMNWLNGRALNESEKRLLHVNRLYAVLSHVNQHLVRLQGRDALLKSVCDIAITHGNFGLAWIGRINKSDASIELQSVSSRALASPIDLAKPISVNDDLIQEFQAGRAVIRNNGLKAAHPLAEYAFDLDCRSAACTPIQTRFEPSLVLCVCAQESTFFSDKEIDLLREVALDIAFGLDMLHHETLRRQTESELVKSEERYRLFFEETLTGAYIATADGELKSCNPAFLKMFGYHSLEEALKSNMTRHYRNPADRPRLIEKLKRNRKVEYSEVEMIRTDGKPIFAVANVVGRFDQNGELVQIQGYLFDDTKRRELEAQLIQSQKMESLGTLAGGIAHDFNNLLAIILGHSLLLKRAQADPKKLSDAVSAIETSSKRGISLVRQLLTFARKGVVTFEIIMVNTLIRELATLIRETFPQTISLKLELADPLPWIGADGSYLHQVLLNLCINARDAMPEGGQLTLSTRVTSGTTVRTKFPSANTSEYVTIEVADTGTGMDDETRSRIFEPFFTTKETGKGTGLGLSMVFGIVQSLQGIVDVESAPGAGTRFFLHFPVREIQRKPADTAVLSRREAKGGNETILLVEDEALLREMAKLILVSKGYNVLTADDGEMAIEVVERRQQTIDLVLTDLGLPKMSGTELVSRLRQIRTDIRIIVATGYLEPHVKTKLLAAGVDAILQKPYEPDTIEHTVRQVLDS